MLWWLLINIITSIVKDMVTSHDNSIFYILFIFQFHIKEIEKFCEIELLYNSVLFLPLDVWMMNVLPHHQGCNFTDCDERPHLHTENGFPSCPHYSSCQFDASHRIDSERLGWNWYTEVWVKRHTSKIGGYTGSFLLSKNSRLDLLGQWMN